MTEKPWDGRFEEKTDREVEAFTASIAFDQRLFPFDIDGSIAHAKMLAATSIITEDEAGAIVEGLSSIRRDLERGKFEFDDGLEDIHMHIETRLTQDVGKAAQKLHTARSRNDQVALDTRLYLRCEMRQVRTGMQRLMLVLVNLAKEHLGVVLPGYTHLQRAQPVLLSHHLLAYYEMFRRDAERLADGLKRVDVLPLGSAALAGTPHPIDRAFTARLLEFPAVSRNSIDSVADRDFIIEFLAGASIAMVHLSRIAEELILWSTTEFAFIELPDAFATGSSIMPQKKNPDVPELIRGKTGRVFGNLMALLTIMKSLPLAYNRDMQEDKEPLFDTVDTLKNCINLLTRMLPRIKVKAVNMQQAAAIGFLNATDLADYLAARGMPFREAHAVTGKAVAYALGQGKELHTLSLKELQDFSNLFKADVFDFLSIPRMIDRRTSQGGTATVNVQAAIAEAETYLADFI